MRTSWQALHAGFERTIRTLSSMQEFQAMKQVEAELEGFADPSAIVGYLANRGGDLDCKDRLLAVLVRRFQRGENTELVSALLWLGLWPGLDAVFRKNERYYPDDSAAAVSEIAAAFTDLAASLDLEKVQRVACSLVFGTHRNLIRTLRRQWRTNERFFVAGANPVDLIVEGQRHNGKCFRTNWESPLCRWLLPSADGDVDATWAIAKLHESLEALIGADAELLMAVLVFEETQLEVAERLGLSHAAARKRLQRARGRLRNELTNAVSQSGAPAGVSGGRGEGNPGGRQR